MSKFINTYKEYLQSYPDSLRTKMRNKYIDLFASKHLDKERLPKKSILFILFHSLYDDQVENFRKVLIQIQKQYTFISYSECVQRVNQGNIDDRYACISADDGFKNFLKAADLFDELSIPGMVFVNSGLIEEKKFEVLEHHCNKRLGCPAMEFLSWKDLEHLRKRNHEIGNHGKMHEKLTLLNQTQMEDEINSGKEELEQNLGTIPHYAYTYGMQQFINQTAQDLIFAAGHTSIASAVRGQHTAQMDTNKNIIMREQFECWYPSRHVNFFLERNQRS